MPQKQSVQSTLRCFKSSTTGRSYGLEWIVIVILAIGMAPLTVSAQDAVANENARDVPMIHNATLTRTGIVQGHVSGRKPDKSRVMGGNLSPQSHGVAQQELTDFEVRGSKHKSEFRSRVTSGNLDRRFGASADFPIAGANQAARDEDRLGRSNFALTRTFHIGQSEYQWSFRKSHKDRNNKYHGHGGYVMGISYSF